MSYLFKYKINYTSKNIMYVGFPKRIVQKIKAILEQKKINYLLIDTRNNYDVDEKADNKNLNQYNTILCNAEKYIKIKRRIDKIRITLEKEIESESIKNKIEKIEEIVYEGRKI